MPCWCGIGVVIGGSGGGGDVAKLVAIGVIVGRGGDVATLGGGAGGHLSQWCGCGDRRRRRI